MKKGYLSLWHQESLSAMSHILRHVAEGTTLRVPDFDALFYATAFQAGIDEFVLPEHSPVTPTIRSTFIASRTMPFSSRSNFENITNAFSIYLPDDWRGSPKFGPVNYTAVFINDLLDAMATRASHLSIHPAPDLVELKELMPDELYIPVSHLLSSFTAVETLSPVPQKVVSTDDMHKLNNVLSGDLFRKYANSQSSVDNSEIPLEKALPLVVSNGRLLFVQNRNLLALRNASVNILQMTPKLIDAVFGKLPGALAEVAAKLGISFLEERRRLVVYDFERVMYKEVLMPKFECLIAVGVIRLLAKYLKREADGTFSLADDGRGIRVEDAEDLRRSLEITNAMIRRGDLDPASHLGNPLFGMERACPPAETQ
jgi:hypothetical protein